MEHVYKDRDTVEQVKKVVEYAGSLGLHGVVILSPICPDCGAVHHWNMLTDLMPSGDGRPDDRVVRELLLYHADRVDQSEPVVLGPGRHLDG